MSNVNSSTAQDTKKVETLSPIPLLDCGQASKVTKGMPYYAWWEGGPPPFDRTLV